jgi:catechol 2,3-dioxygenase-like lactoylglutathione lyase family enzyme
MYRTVIFLVLTMACGASAQDTQPVAFTFDHVALSVSDVDRSRAFYEAVFGMQNITDRPPVEGVRWLSMGGGKELHLLAVVDGEVTVNQAVHISVKTNDFDRLLVILDERQVEYTTWLGTEREVTVTDSGTRQLYLRDPDGYWIEVNSLPNSRDRN